MFQPKFYLMAAEDGVSGSSTTVSSDLAELNNDSEESPDIEYEPEPEPETEPEEEEEEEEQPVAELHPFERPSLKNIQETYPDFFKKFPSMRDMYFREAEYSKIYPTIEDAKEAQENNTAFQNLRDDIFSGNGERLLGAIKGQDPKALHKFAGNFLGTLVKVDNEAFWRAANPLVEDIARSMFARGVNEGNESMANAARYLSHYFFGNVDVAEGKTTTIKREEPQNEVSKEKEEWENKKQFEFRGVIENDVRGQLTDIIVGLDERTGKAKLDPQELLSPFIRQTIIDRVIQDIGSTLGSDDAHLKYMDSLWARARINGRTTNDKERIVNAYLNRARAMAPALRSKYVSEALGKRVRAAGEKVSKVQSIPGRTPNIGKTPSNGRTDYNPKQIDYRKTSDYDILNDDIKYKQ
jgi:hypothetical protein